MAKQVTKKITEGPLTPEEQAFINKHYERTSGEKMKPGTIAEISKEDLKVMRSGKSNFATYYMGKTIEKPKETKPVIQAKLDFKKEEPTPKKEEPKKPIVKAVVESKPAQKVKVQDTRGYNKQGKQNIIAKTTEKLTGKQSLRRAAEILANKALDKVGSGLKFKKALREPVKKK